LFALSRIQFNEYPQSVLHSVETITEELGDAYDIITYILKLFPELDNGHRADLYLSDTIQLLEKVKAHTETTFKTFDKLGLVNY